MNKHRAQDDTGCAVQPTTNNLLLLSFLKAFGFIMLNQPEHQKSKKYSLIFAKFALQLSPKYTLLFSASE